MSEFFSTAAAPFQLDTLSNQILAQFDNRTSEEKQVILQIIKNILKLRDLPDTHLSK